MKHWKMQDKFADLRAFPLDAHTAIGLLPFAFNIAVEYHLAVYDCLYIALAEALNLPLITADEQQARVATSSDVTLKPMTEFPEFVEPQAADE